MGAYLLIGDLGGRFGRLRGFAGENRADRFAHGGGQGLCDRIASSGIVLTNLSHGLIVRCAAVYRL